MDLCTEVVFTPDAAVQPVASLQPYSVDPWFQLSLRIPATRKTPEHLSSFKIASLRFHLKFVIQQLLSFEAANSDALTVSLNKLNSGCSGSRLSQLAALKIAGNAGDYLSLSAHKQ